MLADKVADSIYKMIKTENKFEAGEKLPNENEMAKMFGVSRTTLRESVKILATAGVLEIKSGAIREEEMPHEGDLMQLCCYFYMASEEFGRKVKYGKIIYSDYMFEIKNTAKLRRKLKKTIIRMRKMLSGSREAAKPDYVKCRHCVCAGTVCEYCGIEE